MSRAHFALVLALAFLPAPLQGADVSRYTDGKHGKGELKHINGLPVLVVEGTPEEIGEQVAVLTEKPLGRLFPFPRKMVEAHGAGVAWPVLVSLAQAMEPQFPPD